tara:strand:+ start:1140 stop:1493 length:354 start_codon:yes stop_codon:yes gene_type:complete
LNLKRFIEKSKLSIKELDEILNDKYIRFIKLDHGWITWKKQGKVAFITTFYNESLEKKGLHGTIYKDELLEGGFKDLLNIFKKYGCSKIKFVTKRNPKVIHRCYGFKPTGVLMEMEI